VKVYILPSIVALETTDRRVSWTKVEQRDLLAGTDCAASWSKLIQGLAKFARCQPRCASEAGR
jgi:hypothetical protein